MTTATINAQPPGVEIATRPSTFRIWFQAVRFPSFTASVIPIVVGSALALVEREFDGLLFVVMVLASVACHAGANMANDYFDHRKGVDTEKSLGLPKVIQLGYLTPAQVLRGTIVALGLATALGLYIVYRTGWPILVLALFSLAAAVLYTGGPKPLGYVALGELTVFVFMGLVMVCGAYFVHTGELTGASVLLALPIACLATAILHCNNIRDIELDRSAGKRTLANTLGRAWADREYVVLIAGAYVAVAVLIAYQPRLWPTAIAFLSLPTAIALIRLVTGDSGAPELNRALRRTAGLHMQMGLLLAAGLLARTAIDRVF